MCVQRCQQLIEVAFHACQQKLAGLLAAFSIMKPHGMHMRQDRHA